MLQEILQQDIQVVSANGNSLLLLFSQQTSQGLNHIEVNVNAPEQQYKTSDGVKIEKNLKRVFCP